MSDITWLYVMQRLTWSRSLHVFIKSGLICDFGPYFYRCPSSLALLYRIITIGEDTRFIAGSISLSDSSYLPYYLFQSSFSRYFSFSKIVVSVEKIIYVHNIETIIKSRIVFDFFLKKTETDTKHWDLQQMWRTFAHLVGVTSTIVLVCY